MVAPIEQFYVDLGKRLLDRRLSLGLTQKEVGERLQPTLTRASVANIEAGKQRVLAHTFVALAAALESTVVELVPVPATTDTDIKQELTGKVGYEIAAAVLSHIAASTGGASNESRPSKKARRTPRRATRR